MYTFPIYMLSYIVVVYTNIKNKLIKKLCTYRCIILTET